jgi:predicted site-specific integrase-resolvase
MDYITAQQAADKWGVSLRWVQVYLKDGRIKGAIRFGRVWMIPKTAKKPVDGRLKKQRKSTPRKGD